MDPSPLRLYFYTYKCTFVYSVHVRWLLCMYVTYGVGGNDSGDGRGGIINGWKKDNMTMERKRCVFVCVACAPVV